MVKLFMGLSGSGKTKEMIRTINEAAQQERGSVVCIEKGNKLTYDIHYKVRLIDYREYALEGAESLKAFICGLHAGNFDISHIFLKSIHKLIGSDDMAKLTEFCDWCETFGAKNQVSFTMTATEDPQQAPEALKKYF
ncbi:MAG: hypothetical protein PT958_00975 [Firmicutes bacterium]|nr:hypothetical protein [Bacillota bacterium]MDY2720484.1 hypothetical protein [Candidatus Faecousia sp.]